MLQYLREVNGLAAAVETFEAAKIADVDVRLARGALEELRAVPDAVAQSAALPRALRHVRARQHARPGGATAGWRSPRAPTRRCSSTTRPSSRRTCGWRAWSSASVAPSEAEAHLVRVAGLKPDARQAYLAALFLADVYERQGRIADAIAAYGVAQQNWPGAQTPGIGVARLRALSGHTQEARAALAGLHLERAADAPERSDPWMGYIGAQAWRLPSGIAALQASFEAEP